MLGASKNNQASASHFTASKRAGKVFESRTITLEPGATKQVALGSYFISEPKPEFAVTANPANLQEKTDASLELIDIPGSQKYIAFYHLHNAGNARCDITIAKRA
jgi:hypothetical protein